MTTVVYDGRNPKQRVVAADSRVSGGVPLNTQKIHRVGRAVIAFCGDMEEALRFVAWYKDKRKPFPDFSREEDDEWEALVITKTKAEWWGPGGVPINIQEPYYAIGSGAEYAIGALDHGATLAEAMNIAVKRDNGSERPIVTIKV